MEPLSFADLPQDALVLVDTAPIIYVPDAHPTFEPRFKHSLTPTEPGNCASP